MSSPNLKTEMCLIWAAIGILPEKEFSESDKAKYYQISRTNIEANEEIIDFLKLLSKKPYYNLIIQNFDSDVNYSFECNIFD